MTSTRWCFTINNYSEDDEQSCTDFLSSGNVVYGVVGREIGESGTPHLQGFVILHNPQRLSFLRRKISDRGHYERCNGTSEQNRDYCRKDGDFEEFGTFPSRQGARTDLDRLLAWADEFTVNNGRAPTSPDIAKHQPHAYLKYPRFKSLCAHRAPVRALEFGEPNDWQRELEQQLSQPADDRSVKFYVDIDGGKGKTWFCRYMLTNNAAVQVLGIGRKSDIAYMVDETKSIFLFNIGRGQIEYLSQPLLEALKDRLLTSTKYAGCLKTWTTNVHVVVFCNEAPEQTMTEDRYDIKFI